MFCSECGTQNPDTNQFCKNCRKPFRKSVATVPGVQPAPVVQAAPPAPIAQAPVPATSKSTFGPGFFGTIRSRILSLLSILIAAASWFYFPYVLGVFSILVGIIALYKKDKLGVLGIIIGLVSMLADMYWLNLFVQ